MTTLSVVREGHKAISAVAATIFIVSDANEWGRGIFRFEVFDADSDGLRAQLGEMLLYATSERTFWGRLNSLEPCVSTHPGLSLLRHKPTQLATMSVIDDPDQATQ